MVSRSAAVGRGHAVSPNLNRSSLKHIRSPTLDSLQLPFKNEKPAEAGFQNSFSRLSLLQDFVGRMARLDVTIHGEAFTG